MNKDYEKKSRSAASKFLGGENIPADQEAPAAEQPKRRTTTKKKTETPPAEEPKQTPEAKDKKPKGKGLTVWMTEAEIDRLQLYSKITGDKKGEIISAALAEYMKKHPVTAAQKKAYQEEQTRLMSNV